VTPARFAGFVLDSLLLLPTLAVVLAVHFVVGQCRVAMNLIDVAGILVREVWRD
jgi:hypothetical protein